MTRRSDLVLAFLGGAVVLGLAACGRNPPAEPSDPGPVLLSPAPGVRFQQNNASIGCPAHAAAGHGIRVAFDWQDFSGAIEYRLTYGRIGAARLIDETVQQSHFERTSCGSYVADVNLDSWTWRVGAVVPRDGARADTVWSLPRENGFAPCRLADGRPCHSTE